VGNPLQGLRSEGFAAGAGWRIVISLATIDAA
jgi:hypothetical protein